MDLSQIGLLLLLGAHDLIAAAFERKMAGEKAVEQHAHGIDVRGKILYGNPSLDEFRGGVFHLPHKRTLAGRITLALQVFQLGDDTKVDELDLAVRGDHDVGRVDVPVQESGVVQGGDGRQHVLDDVVGNLLPVGLITLIQVLGIVDFLSGIVGAVPFQDVVQGNAAKEFAHYVQAFFHKAQAGVFHLHETQHLHQVVVP